MTRKKLFEAEKSNIGLTVFSAVWNRALIKGRTSDGSTNDSMEAVLAAVPDRYPSLLYWPLSIKGKSAFTNEILSADPRKRFSSAIAPAEDRLLHTPNVLMGAEPYNNLDEDLSYRVYLLHLHVYPSQSLCVTFIYLTQSEGNAECWIP